MSSPEIHLPQGYSLDTAPELEEIVGLLYCNVSDWVFRQHYTTRYRNERANHAQAGISFLSFGVRDVASSDLIGIGEIALQADHVGHLANLTVHPAHRRQGIGRCILDARVEEADRRGIALTTQLSYMNPMAKYYREIGFVGPMAPGSLLRRPARST